MDVKQEYKEYSNKEILDKVYEVLQNEEYKDFELTYVLKVKDECQNCYAVAMYEDEIIGFNPFEKEIQSLPEWDFNIDGYLFQELECNREIIYVSPDFNYTIWYEITKYYPEEFEHKEGIQKYLKYCKENKIDIKKIKELGDADDIDNIMKYLKDKNKNREAR